MNETGFIRRKTIVKVSLRQKLTCNKFQEEKINILYASRAINQHSTSISNKQKPKCNTSQEEKYQDITSFKKEKKIYVQGVSRRKTKSTINFTRKNKLARGFMKK